MHMTIEELEKLFDLAIKKRVSKLKWEGFELELSALAYVTPSDEEIRTGKLDDVDVRLTEEERFALLPEDDPERLLYIQRNHMNTIV